jgi:hypothetical protein
MNTGVTGHVRAGLKVSNRNFDVSLPRLHGKALHCNGEPAEASGAAELNSDHHYSGKQKKRVFLAKVYYSVFFGFD